MPHAKASILSLPGHVNQQALYVIEERKGDALTTAASSTEGTGASPSLPRTGVQRCGAGRYPMTELSPFL
jgi:hypothetical protein